MCASGLPQIFRSKSHQYATVTSSHHHCSFVNLRGDGYKSYDAISLEKAIVAVENGDSIRKAAEKYGVPRSTLYDHCKGKYQTSSKCGAKPYLTAAEEEELVSFLDKSSRIGYPYTRKQVLALVQQILDSKNINTKVSNGWWERFQQRHPAIRLRSAMPLSVARAKATDYEVLDNYFDMLKETLESNGIINNASCIYNCDESGFPLSPKCPKVVCEVGTNPTYVTSDTKTQITVLVCANAAGTVLPPFVIFDRKSLNPQLTIGQVPNTIYGLSPNGWIDRGLFSDWFFHHFLKFVPSFRPLLLLMDGHSSHYCPEVIRYAAKQKILVLTLPPNTTHLTQPLDKGLFSVLKKSWREICHDFTVKNPGRCVTRYDFSQLFSQAWYKSMTVSNIMAGFKKTGVCPFDRNAIKLPYDFSYQHFQPEELVKESGLAYIPMYSPKPSRHKQVEVPQHHLSSSSSDDDYCAMPQPQPTSINKFFTTTKPPSLLPVKFPKSSGRVLTQEDQLKALEEKERKKLEEERRKEEKRRLKEERAKLKETGT